MCKRKGGLFQLTVLDMLRQSHWLTSGEEFRTYQAMDGEAERGKDRCVIDEGEVPALLYNSPHWW